jgi:predicted MFS family arabinose efflux permease
VEDVEKSLSLRRGGESSLLDPGATMTTPARARWAVTAVFAVNGAIIAGMSVRTPSIKIEHGLSVGQLGLSEFCFGVAALAAMQFTGGWAARLGSAPIVRLSALLLPLSLLTVALSPGFLGLSAAMLLVGAVDGVLDVTMNAHAVAVERELGRPILNGCHAAWSLGAVAGATTGGLAAGAGLGLRAHFAVLAALLAMTALIAGARLLPASTDSHAAVARPSAGLRTGWSVRLALIGAMGAIVLTCEAAVGSWSGVLLHDHFGTSLGVASIGYIAFVTCQTAARLIGDRLRTRHSASVMVRTGAVVAATALTVSLVSPWATLSICAFAAMGLGLATLLPIIFSVVGHLGADGPGASLMVSRFTTMSYSGIVLAPAVIGWSAQSLGLVWTLAILVPLLAAVARQAHVGTLAS